MRIPTLGQSVRAVVSLILTSIIMVAHADDFSVGQVCNEILQRGQITNNTDIYSASDTFDEYRHRLCDQHFDSYQSMKNSASSLGIDVVIYDVPLGLQGSDDQKSAEFSQHYASFCTSTYAASSNKQWFQSHRSEISSSLVASWVACMDTQKDAYLNSHGIFTNVTAENYSTFTAVVDIGTKSTGNPVVDSIAGSVSCSYAGKTLHLPQTFQTKEFSLTCTKPPAARAVFSVDVRDVGASQQTVIPAAPSQQELDASRMETLINQAIARALVVGEIRAFAISERNSVILDNIEQRGWIPADGRSLSKSDYPELYTALGTVWGTPANANEFFVPDFRGTFLRGYSGDQNNDPDKNARGTCQSGGASGNTVGSCQPSALQVHTHALNIYSWTNRHGAQGTYDQSGGGTLWGSGAPVGANISQSETRPINASVFYFIYAGQPTIESRKERSKAALIEVQRRQNPK